MTSMRPWSVLLCAVLGGCAGVPFSMQVTQAEREWLLNGAGLESAVVPEAVRPPERVLAMTDEMRRFAESSVVGQNTERGKLLSLLEAIISPTGLSLVYDPSATYTAEEAFLHRQANCLSFTLMVVALARHVGLPATFNEVDIPSIWDLQSENTLVLFKHVNAMFEDPSGPRQVVDISMAEYDSSFEQRVIPDDLALAQYFNNRAMELLKEQRFADALGYQRMALTMKPQVSYFWANLGSLYRRAGNQRAAELAFRAALEVNPGDLVAISNAARLYEELGMLELAADFSKRADHFRMRNPYFRFKLAQDDFLQRHFVEAREHLVMAIHFYPLEHRFHFLLGAVYLQLGDRDQARTSMDKAIELSTDQDQNTRYRSKMSKLLSATL